MQGLVQGTCGDMQASRATLHSELRHNHASMQQCVLAAESCMGHDSLAVRPGMASSPTKRGCQLEPAMLEGGWTWVSPCAIMLRRARASLPVEP